MIISENYQRELTAGGKLSAAKKISLPENSGERLAVKAETTPGGRSPGGTIGSVRQNQRSGI
jgi:hypothetical protein